MRLPNWLKTVRIFWIYRWGIHAARCQPVSLEERTPENNPCDSGAFGKINIPISIDTTKGGHRPEAVAAGS